MFGTAVIGDRCGTQYPMWQKNVVEGSGCGREVDQGATAGLISSHRAKRKKKKRQKTTTTTKIATSTVVFITQT